MEQARFYAVAVAERLMHPEECWVLDERQHRNISAGRLPQRCGELAVGLGILTQRVVDRILQLEERYRAEGKCPPDPLAAGPRLDPSIRFGRRRGVAGVAVLIVLAATWYWVRDGSAVFGVASVMGTLWIALEAVFPAGFKGPIAAPGHPCLDDCSRGNLSNLLWLRELSNVHFD